MLTRAVQGRTFFLDQHGCAKNQVDGELLIARLVAQGMVRVDDAADADVILVNSCGFIEDAKKESLDAVMAARTAYPGAKILLAGCLAERYAGVLAQELPEADGILGNGDLAQVDGAVEELLAGGRPVMVSPQRGVCCGDRDALLSFAGSAYVKITEGCDNRCSFCAIPLIRGALRSRPAEEIVAEVERLVRRGIREVNLIGQDLAAYGRGAEDVPCEPGHSPLYRLLERIAVVDGDFWVRLLYIHPDHFDRDILDVMRRDARFLPYFDIPFQSGADEVIHTMNRRGTFDDYVRLVQDIRAALPEACIRTTFLTGFPGETEAQAARTREFLAAIQGDWSGCFVYSREEGTPAARMRGQVPRKVAAGRARALEAAQDAITATRLAARLPRTYTVLVEEVVEPPDGDGAAADEGLAIGRAWFQAPEVDGSVVIRYDRDDARACAAVVPGAMVRVRCFAVSGVDVDGELVL